MNEAERRLAELADRQRQVFTRAQARGAGVSASGLSRRLVSGLFVPVGTHSLTFAGVTLDWRGQLQAGILDLGRGTLVSAEAAAAMHELDGFDEGPLVYLVPRELRERMTAGEVTSSSDIHPLDKCVVDGLPVVSGTRAVVEVLSRCNVTQAGNALDSATRKRITAPTVVERRLVELGRQGRAGVAMFDELMKLAGVESWLERKFLKLIRETGLPEPALQRTYREDGVHVARVDFDFAPLPIIVEVGGQRGYMSTEERRRQEHRRNAMQLVGKVIYFFTTEDVRDTPDYVLGTLHGCIPGRAS